MKFLTISNACGNCRNNCQIIFLFFLIVVWNNLSAREISPLPENLATMTSYRDHVGTSYYFYVTGNTTASLYGTDIYTDDSNVGAAAVHKGLLADGQKGIIKVSVLSGQSNYSSSTANGISSSAFGSWPGSFSVSADDGGNNPILSDPGNLTSYRNVLGGVYQFNVIGSSMGSVWGSNVYTDDSTLAKVAVHAGILSDGQSGVVRVVIAPGLEAYVASTANGITSASFGEWSGSYTVSNSNGSQVLIAYPGSFENPISDVGSLTSFRDFNGGAFYFNVTGTTSGSVWGSAFYTDDSTLAKAAVHAGVLNDGQSGIVKATIALGQSSYTGSFANGVNSSSFGEYSGSYVLSFADGELGLIPVINSSLEQNLNSGDALSYQISASHSPTYYQATGLPESFSVSTSGRITGTALISGTFPIELLVSNSSGTSTKTLILNIAQSSSGGTNNGTGGSGTGDSGTDSSSSSITGTVAENLDISVPYLDYTSLLGTQSIWVKFTYAGVTSTGEHLWKLSDYGLNNSSSPSGAGTVAQNLDIHMPSLDYNSLFGTQNIWASFTFHGQGTNSELLWKLTDFGSN